MTRRHLVISSLTLVFAVSATAPITALAADGDLDPTFGIGGRVRYEDSSASVCSASAIQSDGKIIVAGSIGNLDWAAFVLTRFKADGSLDTTFGIGGKVTTDFGQGGSTIVNAIAIQPDGKILAAGEAGTTSNPDFALARYNPDGSLDVTFGVGGKVTTDFSGLSESAFALATQSDGKIVAAGSASYKNRGLTVSDFGLARYNPDGSLDTSFGIAGKVTTDFLGREDWARAVAIQSDGKIIAAGIMAIAPGGTPYFDLRVRRGALVRYNKDGSLDSTFGTGGKVITEILGPSALNALSIQSDGKIIAAGHSGVLNGSVSDGRWFEIFRSGPTAMDFALVRYNEDGSLDTTFGAQGKVETDLNTPSDVIYAVSLQPDGKIIATGNAGLSDWAPPVSHWAPLARYNRDGSLDTTFGIGGKVRMDLPAGQAATAHFVGIQPDGKIVVTGNGTTHKEDGRVLNTVFELARYDNKGLQIVSAIDLAASTIRIGGSMSVRLSGSSLTDRTWFDVRFRSPAGTTEQVALNWQQGTSADHVVAAGTEVGIWVVTGIRAHESVSDQGGEFVPVSASITVKE